MSERTRLETFAAAALTGILSNGGGFGIPPEVAAARAVALAQALGEEVDRQYGADADDPDTPRHDGGRYA